MTHSGALDLLQHALVLACGGQCGGRSLSVAAAAQEMDGVNVKDQPTRLIHSMQLHAYLLLGLVDAKPGTRDTAVSEPSSVRPGRWLNSGGRWAVNGTRRAPLLAWTTAQSGDATSAAARASALRKRRIEAFECEENGGAARQAVRLFTTDDEPALRGYLDVGCARDRPLQVDVERLEMYCAVVQDVFSAVGQDAYAAACRAASDTLRARFGGGSYQSAAAWLAGRTGRLALQQVHAGQVGLSGVLSVREIDAAYATAMRLRRSTHPIDVSLLR